MGFSFSTFLVSFVLALLQSSFPVALGFEVAGEAFFASSGFIGLVSFSSFFTLSLGSSLTLEDDADGARPGFFEEVASDDLALAIWTFPIYSYVSMPGV